MKIRQTLVFMFKNPAPILLYFFLCWILFSALVTISDDPFQYGTLPEAADEVKEVGKNLPWSLWKLCTALTLMIEEIATDMSYEGIWFMIIPALFIGYLEARGNLKGVENKRKELMILHSSISKDFIEGQSDVMQQNTENGQDTSIPWDSSDTVQSNFYFMKQLLYHFIFWIVVSAILTIVMYLTVGKGESIQLFIKYFEGLLIPSAVLSLLSSYRSSRGYVKGINAKHRELTDWYNRQKELIAAGDNLEELPLSVNYMPNSKYKTFIDTVVFMLRNPSHLLIHFTAWIIAGLLILLVSIGIYEGLSPFPAINDIIWILLVFCSVPAAIFSVIVNFRASRGIQKGMELEQDEWNRWYSQQTETQEGIPISETTQSDSYLLNAKKTLISLARKPQLFLLHLVCWITGFVFVYGITNLIVLEALPDFGQILLVFILAFISSYQEMKGIHNGRSNQRQVWIDWYHQQHQDSEKESQFSQTPPMLEVY